MSTDVKDLVKLARLIELNKHDIDFSKVMPSDRREILAILQDVTDERRFSEKVITGFIWSTSPKVNADEAKIHA